MLTSQHEEFKQTIFFSLRDDEKTSFDFPFRPLLFSILFLVERKYRDMFRETHPFIM